MSSSPNGKVDEDNTLIPEKSFLRQATTMVSSLNSTPINGAWDLADIVVIPVEGHKLAAALF